MELWRYVMGTIFACVALMSRYYLRGLGSTIAGTIRRGGPLGRASLGRLGAPLGTIPRHRDAAELAVPGGLEPRRRHIGRRNQLGKTCFHAGLRKPSLRRIRPLIY